MPIQRAFTLIELLVVITIIVVLLALLTPALDKAIYQAELTVCGTRLHAVAVGTITYAGQNKRHYPRRPGTRDTTFWQPHQLYNGNPLVRGGPLADDRPILRTYLDINGMLNDPLSGEVDFINGDDDTALNASDASIYGSYALWFDWRYTKQRGGKGNHRLGDAFELDGKRFNLLASDCDAIAQGVPAVLTSHPDYDGRLRNEVLENGNFDFGAGEEAGAKLTISSWRLDGSAERPFLDLNFAYGDASVARLVKVPWNGDERTVQAPHWNNERVPTTFMTLPAR